MTSSFVPPAPHTAHPRICGSTEPGCCAPLPTQHGAETAGVCWHQVAPGCFMAPGVLFYFFEDPNARVLRAVR